MSGGICSSCGDSVNGYCFNCMGYVEEGMGSFYPDSSVDDYYIYNDPLEIDDLESLDIFELTKLADQVISSLDDQIMKCFQSSNSNAVSYSVLTNYNSAIDSSLDSSEYHTLELIREGIFQHISSINITNPKLLAMPTFDDENSAKTQQLINDLICTFERSIKTKRLRDYIINPFKRSPSPLFSKENLVEPPINQTELESAKALLDIEDIPLEVLIGRKLYPHIDIKMEIKDQDVVILGKQLPPNMGEEILIHLIAGKLIQTGAKSVHCLAIMTHKDNSHNTESNRTKRGIKKKLSRRKRKAKTHRKNKKR